VSGIWVSVSFHGSVRVRTRFVGRLGLELGSGLHVVGRFGPGMRVNTSFQLQWIALYRLAHGGGSSLVGKEGGELSGRMCHTLAITSGCSRLAADC